MYVLSFINNIIATHRIFLITPSFSNKFQLCKNHIPGNHRPFHIPIPEDIDSFGRIDTMRKLLFLALLFMSTAAYAATYTVDPQISALYRSLMRQGISRISGIYC